MSKTHALFLVVMWFVVSLFWMVCAYYKYRKKDYFLMPIYCVFFIFCFVSFVSVLKYYFELAVKWQKRIINDSKLLSRRNCCIWFWRHWKSHQGKITVSVVNNSRFKCENVHKPFFLLKTRCFWLSLKNVVLTINNLFI